MRRLARTGIGLVLATVAFSTAAHAQTATHTTLSAETREVGGHTVATFTASVTGADGTPATGIVSLMDGGKAIAGAALDSEGKAEIKLDSLTAGDHSLRAVYSGTGASSHSETLVVHPEASPAPDFTLAIAPASLTVKQGAAGTVVVSVAPVTSSGFTGFISLSCAGTGNTTTLPVGVTCSFSPANLQVTSASAVTADLSIQTSTAGGTSAQNLGPNPPASNGHPLILAVLLPGIAGLGYLGRKRKILVRLSLLALLGTVTLVGTSACSARYYYLNHGPKFGGTALGSYTITVTAQTSNGVTASAHSTPLALTVN
jgi:hypothetical protein